MSEPMRNYSLRDQIRDYWAIRAATYDQGRGHGMSQRGELEAWLEMIHAKLGPGEGRSALDLATGTGEIAQLMHRAGFAVTGMDFTEPMLDRARSKAAAAGLPIRYLLRDVETTGEPDASYDILICRNLVWTLVDPAASFAEWLRLLRPGGTLMIVDADHVSKNWADRLHRLWTRWFGAKPDGHSMLTAAQWQNHHAIVAQLPFSAGARAKAIAAMLEDAGYGAIHIDQSLRPLRRISARGNGWTGWLRSAMQHRFVICCTKPLSG
jgi:ubiquinone/menaquinone biosynthesis C-methylase UbiE